MVFKVKNSKKDEVIKEASLETNVGENANDFIVDADSEMLMDAASEVIIDLESEGVNGTNAKDPLAFAGKTMETMESLKEALNQKNESLLRTVAEFQNYRKRAEKEKQDVMKYANEKIMKDLITVHDNFERAIGSMDKENEAIASVVSGVEMIKKSFDDILDRYGIKEIDANGQPFNPEQHHAVMAEDQEGTPANTVIEVFQKGYTLHERVIRPAMVKVSN